MSPLANSHPNIQQSNVDESMISGEAALVVKQQGDSVIGGTVNGAGAHLAQPDDRPCRDEPE